MTLTLSKSEVATLRRCPRRYYYEYVLERTPAAGQGVEAEWGTALHRGLEVLDKMREERGDAALQDALVCALTPSLDSQGRPYQPPADPYARAALRAMLRAYAAVWGPSDAERYEVLHVELGFDLPVLTRRGVESTNGRQPGARREGRIDAVVRERGCAMCFESGTYESGACPMCNGVDSASSVWLVEHKSTGKPPAEERFYFGLELDLQTALYFDAARIQGLAPAGVLYDVIRRPEFDNPTKPPKLKKCPECKGHMYLRSMTNEPCPTCAATGKVPCKPKSEPCEDCDGAGVFTDAAPDAPGASPARACGTCKGTGRIVVAGDRPRYGEPAAVYEERIYQLATATPSDWFARRELPIADWQIEDARDDMHAAAREVTWRTREGLWPRVGDRYVCAAPRMVCPWLDVCGRRAVAEDDRLYPLKKKEI